MSEVPHLVEVGEERLDHGVLMAQLRVPLLAVLGGPGGEHGEEREARRLAGNNQEIKKRPQTIEE